MTGIKTLPCSLDLTATELKLQLLTHAQNHVNEMTPIESELYKKEIKEYSEYMAKSDNPWEHRYTFAYIHELDSYQNNRAYKAFLLSQSESISLYHPIQSTAFQILEGEELQDYHQQYVQRWKGNSSSSVRDITNAAQYLLRNKDFKIEYIKPYVEHPNLSTVAKLDLMETAIVNMNDREQYLNPQELIFVTDLMKKILTESAATELCIIHLIPSIKYNNNLEDIPDEWVKEMYAIRKNGGDLKGE